MEMTAPIAMDRMYRRQRYVYDLRVAIICLAVIV